MRRIGIEPQGNITPTGNGADFHKVLRHERVCRTFYPKEEQIMAKAGISRPCLTRHMRIAVENGFIERWHWGYGVGNRRYNYRAIIPGQPALTGEMGNEVSQHKPCPIDNQFEKPESAAIPEPYRPEPAPAPAPQPQAAHSVPLRITKARVSETARNCFSARQRGYLG